MSRFHRATYCDLKAKDFSESFAPGELMKLFELHGEGAILSLGSG